tara:strand:+ start:939 stop:1178 length:240 start_codon:yes stop_codon:yes gene_type:complete
MIAVLVAGPFCGTQINLGDDDTCVEMVDQIKVPEWRKLKENNLPFDKEFYIAKDFSGRGVPVLVYEYIGSGVDLYTAER